MSVCITKVLVEYCWGLYSFSPSPGEKKRFTLLRIKAGYTDMDMKMGFGSQREKRKENGVSRREVTLWD